MNSWLFYIVYVPWDDFDVTAVTMKDLQRSWFFFFFVKNPPQIRPFSLSFLWTNPFFCCFMQLLYRNGQRMLIIFPCNQKKMRIIFKEETFSEAHFQLNVDRKINTLLLKRDLILHMHEQSFWNCLEEKWGAGRKSVNSTYNIYSYKVWEGCAEIVEQGRDWDVFCRYCILENKLSPEQFSRYI